MKECTTFFVHSNFSNTNLRSNKEKTACWSKESLKRDPFGDFLLMNWIFCRNFAANKC